LWHPTLQYRKFAQSQKYLNLVLKILPCVENMLFNRFWNFGWQKANTDRWNSPFTSRILSHEIRLQIRLISVKAGYFDSSFDKISFTIERISVEKLYGIGKIQHYLNEILRIFSSKSQISAHFQQPRKVIRLFFDIFQQPRKIIRHRHLLAKFNVILINERTHGVRAF
jgi:hypothetical protein